MSTINILETPASVVDESLVGSRRRLPQLPRSAMLRVGLASLTLFVLVAILGPLILRTEPNALSNNSLAGPSLQHLLGTTVTGQDIFTQLVYGTGLTLLTGFSAGILATLIGTTVGLVSGYFGGWVDDVLSTVINVFLVIPAAPLAIVLAAFASGRGDLPLVLVIVATSWSFSARLIRAQTLSLREREYVLAARVNGEYRSRLIFFEILPHVLPIVATTLVFTTIFAVLTEAALQFIGLGDPLATSWGTMLFWAQSSGTLLRAWWWFLAPGLSLAFLGTSLAFINLGLDTVLNRRLREA